MSWCWRCYYCTGVAIAGVITAGVAIAGVATAGVTIACGVTIGVPFASVDSAGVTGVAITSGVLHELLLQVLLLHVLLLQVLLLHMLLMQVLILRVLLLLCFLISGNCGTQPSSHVPLRDSYYPRHRLTLDSTSVSHIVTSFDYCIYTYHYQLSTPRAPHHQGCCPFHCLSISKGGHNQS